MIKAVILDDDRISREVIKSYINFTDFLVLEAEYDDPKETLEKIDNVSYDLIFLDIEMPGMSGIDFIKKAKNIPQVIIISAKSEYAAESYDYDVTDYLVKPIVYERFLKAVNRAKAINESVSSQEVENEKYIFVKSSGELIKLNYSSILYVEAFADYIQIYTAEKRYTVLSTMKSIHSKLGDEEFIRVHRSFIVSIDKIEAMSDNSLIVGGKKVKVSRNYKKEVKELLKLR